MAKKKVVLKDQLTKKFKSQLAKAKKQLTLAAKFNPNGMDNKLFDNLTRIRIFLDFIDVSKLGKKQVKKINAFDEKLRKSQRLVGGLNAYYDIAHNLGSLFPKRNLATEKFKASVIDMLAIEKRAVQAESMIKLNLMRVPQSMEIINELISKNGLQWISKKKVRNKLKALDLLLKKLRQQYESSCANHGLLDPRTIQITRQLSAVLNATITSCKLMGTSGISISAGKIRKYSRVEKRINAFLGLKDVNIFIKRFKATFGALSEDQLIKLLNESQNKMGNGFSFKKSNKGAKPKSKAVKPPSKKPAVVEKAEATKKVVEVKKPEEVKKPTTAKRGRPKKTATTVTKPVTAKKTTTAVKPTTAKRGRPKKTATTVTKPVTAKKTTTAVKPTTAKRGRPKKTATTVTKPVTAKKTTTAVKPTTAKRGRPKKTATTVTKPVTAKKTTTAVKPTTAKRGRPKKTATTVTKPVTAKKTTTAVKPTTAKRGRPKKTATTVTKPVTAKKTTTAVKPTTAKRGRPKKTATTVTKPVTAKKTTTAVKPTTAKRGRPKKPVKNDLTKLTGVGPAVEKALNSVGIISFQQITSLSEADHVKLDKKLSSFHGRARRVTWAEEAAKLMKG